MNFESIKIITDSPSGVPFRCDHCYHKFYTPLKDTTPEKRREYVCTHGYGTSWQHNHYNDIDRLWANCPECGQPCYTNRDSMHARWDMYKKRDRILECYADRVRNEFLPVLNKLAEKYFTPINYVSTDNFKGIPVQVHRDHYSESFRVEVRQKDFESTRAIPIVAIIIENIGTITIGDPEGRCNEGLPYRDGFCRKANLISYGHLQPSFVSAREKNDGSDTRYYEFNNLCTDLKYHWEELLAYKPEPYSL